MPVNSGTSIFFVTVVADAGCISKPNAASKSHFLIVSFFRDEYSKRSPQGFLSFPERACSAHGLRNDPRIARIGYPRGAGHADVELEMCIRDRFKIPVRFIGVGEGIDQLQAFDRKEFVDSLFGK